MSAAVPPQSKGRLRGNLRWCSSFSPKLLTAVELAHTGHLVRGSGFALNSRWILTSRRSDVTKIGPQHRRGNLLDLRHSKNDADAIIPLSDELGAAIDACPTKHLTYLHTKNGAPRSARALGGDFRRWCDLAGLLKRCSLHGLRKGGARRLAEAGATAREIMSVTGHKTLAEVQRYADAVDKARLARQAIAKLSKERKHDPRLSDQQRTSNHRRDRRRL